MRTVIASVSPERAGALGALMMADSLRQMKFNISPRLTGAVGSRKQGPGGM